MKDDHKKLYGHEAGISCIGEKHAVTPSPHKGSEEKYCPMSSGVSPKPCHSGMYFKCIMCGKDMSPLPSSPGKEDKYIFPEDGGLPNQVGKTDGKGIISWVCPICGSGDICECSSKGVELTKSIWDEAIVKEFMKMDTVVFLKFNELLHEKFSLRSRIKEIVEGKRKIEFVPMADPMYHRGWIAALSSVLKELES